MKKEKSFEDAIGRYGKRLTTEAVHPDTWVGFEEFLSTFRGLLKHGSQLGTEKVHVDWVNSLKFNAVATETDAGEYIGIFAGSVMIIYNHFYAFLADPNFLLSIGNPRKESRRNVNFRSFENLELLLPIDEDRKNAAMHLAWNAVMFVFWHEVAHLIQGHLKLVFDEHKEMELLELPMTPLTAEQSRLRLMLELDADQGAAQNSLRQWRKKWENGAFSPLEPLGMEASWSLSISMLFFVMDSFLPTGSVPKWTTHPPPMARFIRIANLSAQPSRREYIGSEEVMLKGLNPIVQWWSQNNLPLSGGRRGIGAQPVEKMNQLMLEFQDRYVDRLENYRKSR